METTQMGGSDPAVIRELQKANENPFPKRNFNEDSKDPLEQLKNQVSSCCQFSMHAFSLLPKAVRSVTPVIPALQVQLSCYGDSVGGDLKSLKSFLDSNLKGNLPSRVPPWKLQLLWQAKAFVALE